MHRKVIWIGTYANEDYFSTINKNVYVQFAANRVQEYYINAMKSIPEIELDVWSALVTVPYPKVDLLKLDYREDKIDGRISVRNVGFCNIKYLSIFSQTKSLTKLLKQYEKEHDLDDTIIIVYSMRIPYLKIANKIKAMYKNVTIINIVPDLPDYMSSEKSFLRSILVKYNKSVLMKEQKSVDGFVLYAEAMAHALNIASNKYIVIEGLVEDSHKLPLERRNNTTKICLYAGGVNVEYGVKNLVEGFLAAELPNVELHIYGLGNYVDELIEVGKRNSRVKYKGCLSPDDMYVTMQKADLLINSRSNEEEYTKFSCPSKVFEYMLSGTPVAMTKLEGIPTEYFDYVYPIDPPTKEGIAASLKRIFAYSEDERLAMGENARKFLLENKNSDIQVNKLLNFVERIRKK